MTKSSTDKEEFISYIEPQLLNTIKASEEMKPLRDNDVTFEYIYYDKEQQLVTNITITPDKYK